MKTKITILLLSISIYAISQNKKTRIEIAEQYADANSMKDADTVFTNLNSQFPNDSLLMRKEGVLYYRYGTAKRRSDLLSKALVQFNGLLLKYPNDAEISLLKCSTTFGLCRNEWYDKTTEQKRILLSNLRNLKAEFEKHIPRLDPVEHNIVYYSEKKVKEIDHMISSVDTTE